MAQDAMARRAMARRSVIGTEVAATGIAIAIAIETCAATGRVGTLRAKPPAPTARGATDRAMRIGIRGVTARRGTIPGARKAARRLSGSRMPRGSMPAHRKHPARMARHEAAK